MSTDTPADGFLSRWSRRKAQARRGEDGPNGEHRAAPADRATEAPSTTATTARTAAAAPQAAVPARSGVGTAPATAGRTAAPPTPPVAAEPLPPPPTLDDVAQLPSGANVARFVGREVDPSVRNAALHKLFSDPAFNVMDGLDIYIDDYGRPDPLPASMLRQMVQSRALGLFKDEPQGLRDDAASAGSSAGSGAGAASDAASRSEATEATEATTPPNAERAAAPTEALDQPGTTPSRSMPSDPGSDLDTRPERIEPAPAWRRPQAPGDATP